MSNKIITIGVLVLLAFAIVAVAQHTGSDRDLSVAENLYPQPGPGDLMIAEQLKATNTHLQEQVRLLTEQNRLLQQMLDELKKKNEMDSRKPSK